MLTMQMDARLRTFGLLVCAVSLTIANPLRAQGFERVRTESDLLAPLLVTATGRSPSLRSMVERIEQSNVIAHLECSQFRSPTMAGRTMLAVASRDVRYVRVQVSCSLSSLDLVSIVGHELQHVVEIASTPAVVDDRSFAALFRTIGFPRSEERFETRAAMEAAERVRSEFRHFADPAHLAARRFEAGGNERSGH